MQRKDTFYLFVLAAIVLVGVLVLAGLQRAIAPELWTLAGIVVGGVAGLARQDSSSPTQGVTIPGSVGPRVNITTAPALSPLDDAQHPASDAPTSPAAPASPAAGSLWGDK